MEPKRDILRPSQYYIILLRKTVGTESKKGIKLIQKHGVSKAMVHEASTLLVFGWLI